MTCLRVCPQQISDGSTMDQKMKFEFRDNCDRVNPDEPLLYRIAIGDSRYYIGFSRSAEHPKKRYEMNVRNLMDGKPYHGKNMLDGYRQIHRALAAASEQQETIVIELLRNVPKNEQRCEKKREIQELRVRHGAASILNVSY
jgi:hypothetical protein